jgi:hypothetical protein
VQHQFGLVGRRAHRHNAHQGPAHRRADRFDIDRVILAFDIGFDVLRQHQHDVVPEDLAALVPSSATHRTPPPDPRRRQPGEKLLHFAAPQLPVQHRPLLLVDTVNLKERLGCIQPDPDNRHRTLLCLRL